MAAGPAWSPTKWIRSTRGQHGTRYSNDACSGSEAWEYTGGKQ